MAGPTWATLFARNSATLARALQPLRARHRAPAGDGDWLGGAVFTPTGPRRYWLFRPAGVRFGERLPLLVMLHGCHQDARGFAASTRMNALAARERFLVLYPEQSRAANGQGCWRWFDTAGGAAQAEAAWIMQAVDQTCMLYAADRQRIAVAGLSAGASMAALLATRYPRQFRAVAMHSGIPPGAAHSPASAVSAMRGRREPAALPVDGSAPWPPLLVLHGDGDGVVSPDNAQAAARLWAAAAGAKEGAAKRVQRGKRYPMQVRRYARGRELAVEWVEIGGLGHAWSGGAAGARFSDPQGPDAARLLWRFVKAQFDRELPKNTGLSANT